RRRCVRGRRAARRAGARRGRRAARDRRRGSAARARAEQDRRGRSAAAAAAGQPLPGRVAGVGADGRGASGVARAHRRALRRSLRGRPALPSVRGRREAGRAVLAGRADRGARRPTRRRARAGAAAAPRAAPLCALPRRLIELPIQRLRADAVLPGRAYHGDAALDLSAYERVELAPGERAVVGTGLAVAIPKGYGGFVQPRSGLADRHGITIVNSPGLIDAGYRGELKVILLNTDRVHPFVVEPGMRIAQLVVLEVPEVELEEVEELPVTERGVRGHGSSGT